MGLSIPGAPGIRVFSPDEVMQQHTQDSPTGELLFQDAAGVKVRLITSTADPEINNSGSGSFFPADEALVLDALSAIQPEFLTSLQCDIYILPYPRSGMLSSSADSRAIYLSPGVHAYEPWQIEFLVAHEIGHCVQRTAFPDTDTAGWERWAALRGTTDKTLFSATAAHAFRPHEIFAEDFRVLFGGSVARRDGSIENQELTSPESVPGLRELYLARAGLQPARALAAWTLFPNPARLGQSLTLRAPSGWESRGDRDLQAALYDLTGRRVREVSLRATASSQWIAQIDEQGGSPALPTGSYWLRVAASNPTATPVTVSVRVIH
jgi:hypothetical protein